LPGEMDEFGIGTYCDDLRTDFFEQIILL
jgi:hypothetical protein